ncbi:TetR/AcrR family transcriptional regulator [Geodermatophilaceae bacterium NBWT11]|nr:TetR/AcrR family transcriptional regulator [Geodermatophilaceae bacterium NBWT11]
MSVGEGRSSIRDQQRLFTRSRLLESGAAVFSDVGYASATVDDIAARAGAGRATFYLHFSGKKDLLEVLYLGLGPEVEAFYGDLDATLESGSRAEMHAWVTRAVRWTLEHKAVISAATVAQVVEGELLQHPLSPVVQDMPLLRERWPTGDQDGLALRISLLMVNLRGALVLLSREWEEDPTHLVDVLTDVWLVALTPPTADERPTA